MSALCLLLTCAQSAPSAPAEVVRTEIASAVGEHFRIEVRSGSQLLADQALAAAEWTVEPTRAALGAKESGAKTQSDQRLLIVMHARDADYQEAWRASEPGRKALQMLESQTLCWQEGPVGVAEPAFRDPAARTSHIFDSTLPLERLAPVGLPMQTRLTIATEAARLLTDQLVSTPGEVAPWFLEGAAGWAAETGFAAAGWIQDPMDEPVLSNRALHVRALRANGTLPALEDIVIGLPAGLASFERPVVDTAVFRFLTDPARAGLMARIRSAARSFESAEGGDPGLRAARGDEEARAQLQDEFEAWVDALDPHWIESLPALTTSGTAWLQVAYPGQPARAWRAEAAGSDQYVITGELEILPGKTQQMNVLLAAADNEFVQVAFTAGHGIDVFHYAADVPESEAWVELAKVEVQGLRTGRSIPFRISVDGPRLAVEIAGQPACTATIPARTVTGRWGLGTQPGSAGRWRKIAFGRL